MGEPLETYGQLVEQVRPLRSVPPPSTAAPDDDDVAALAELTARLAAALRAVRGYVPHRIWWQAGAADALIAYQVREPS